eukprot:TRINITY_DN4185_c0_g1_i1.p1 TRINITY_DN4185_c0_g1~~TRINITY_DN4185_c0_g1_i1.p1  ORF type:complete len:665 (-),score=153.12 TRINITY_DN4185_c0_g1_i1:35-2029(-)
MDHHKSRDSRESTSSSAASSPGISLLRSSSLPSRMRSQEDVTKVSNVKKGELKVKAFWTKWKPRYCVVENNYLLEFKAIESAKPIKVVALANYHLRLAESITGAKHSFGLFPLDINLKVAKEPLFFMAASEGELVEWVTTIMEYAKSHEVDWKESEDQQVMNAFNDPVVISTDKGIILGANDPFLTLFGYHKNDVIGKNVKILMDKNIAGHHDRYMSDYFKTGQKRLIGKAREVTAYRSDGTPIQVVLSLGELLHEEHGNTVTKFIATIRQLNAASFTRGEMATAENVARKVEGVINDAIYRAKDEITRNINESVIVGLLDVLETYRSKNAELVLQNNQLKNAFHSPRSQSYSSLTTDSDELAQVDIESIVVDTTNIVIGERLSESGGSGAGIYSCVVDGWTCAMKEFKVTAGLEKDLLSHIETELKMLESLPVHRNLVRYLFHRRVNFEKRETDGHPTDFHPGPDARVQLFMTKYSTTLSSEIKNKRIQGQHFTQAEIARFCLDIVRGIEVLHNHNIIHRDLKSGNIFAILGLGGTPHTLVIGDFDTAKIVTNIDLPKTTLGTPGYIAPEIMQSKNKQVYTYKADIWSFGMVMYELMTLKRPFEEFSLFEMVKMTEQAALPPIAEDVAGRYAGLIPIWKRCLQHNPYERPTSTEMKEEFIKLL